MTHDPMCTFPDYPYNICWVCNLIAKVRSNEKAKWTHVCPDNNCCHGSPE